MDLTNKKCSCVSIKVRDGEVLRDVWLDEDNLYLNTMYTIYISTIHGYSNVNVSMSNGVKKKLSHVVLGIDNIGRDFVVDHVDNYSLHNCRANVRLVTHTQNRLNSKKQDNCLSVYKGVTRHKTKQKWVAVGYWNKEQVCLGYFDDEKEAGQAYDRFMYTRYPDFASINNGLLSQAEIAECKSASFVAKPTKKRNAELTNIEKNRCGNYTVRYRGDNFSQTFPTLMEAQQFRDDINHEKAAAKPNAKEEKKNMAIVRNKDGIAIILSNPQKGRRQEILVDDDLYHTINAHGWNVSLNYSVTTKIKGKTVRIGNFILGLCGHVPKPSETVDHINQNRLDHRIKSLRYLDRSGQSQNQRKRKKTSSNFIGVSRAKCSTTWRMTITKDKKTHVQSGFVTEENAAREYDKMAKRLFVNPKLNFPEENNAEEDKDKEDKDKEDNAEEDNDAEQDNAEQDAEQDNAEQDAEQDAEQGAEQDAEQEVECQKTHDKRTQSSQHKRRITAINDKIKLTEQTIKQTLSKKPCIACKRYAQPKINCFFKHCNVTIHQA
jgi:hypothetical protein